MKYNRYQKFIQKFISKVHIKSSYQKFISKVHIKSSYQKFISKVHIKSSYQKFISKVHIKSSYIKSIHKTDTLCDICNNIGCQSLIGANFEIIIMYNRNVYQMTN